MSTSVERLTKVLGFDPARSSGGSVFQEAMEEVNKKRVEANKARAIALIEQAVELRHKMDEAQRQFNAQTKKFEKELGKLVSRIEGLAGGKSPAQIEAEAAEAEANAKEDA